MTSVNWQYEKSLTSTKLSSLNALYVIKPKADIVMHSLRSNYIHAALWRQPREQQHGFQKMLPIRPFEPQKNVIK